MMPRTVKRPHLGEEIDFPNADRVWTHVKTGGRYVILLQCVLLDLGAVPAVAYTSEKPDQPVWVRPVSEFLDGRFE